MSYTEKERQLLERCFSTVEPRDHADVYLVRNIPPEVAATLNGVYSRSRLSMRDQLLERLKKGLEAAGRTFDDLQIPATSADPFSSVMADRAGQFLKTYAIDHGHNSLREGSVVHLAVENVSQLVTRFIQRERRCSFEESSTRYISFSHEGHWRDPGVVAAGGAAAAAYEEILARTFTLYQELTEQLMSHLQALRPLQPEEKQGAWLRTLGAEAFDAARYLLTPAILTKWGMVADARTLSDVITELLSHPLEEFRIVGARIEQEAKKALPTLLAHARPNSFQEEVLRTTARAAVEFGASQRIRGPGSPRVELLAFDPELDAKLLASLWFEASDQPFTALLERSRRMTEAERERSMRRVLDARGDRDPLPLAIEGAQPFDFELLVDFGAYRDIGRHRKGFQQQQRLTTAHGYVVPPLIEAAGATERFRAVLDAVAELQPVVAAEHPHAAGYVTPFAFLQRVRIVFEPRQCAYFIELRSGPEGHFAYRQAALDMLSRIESVSPLFASFIRAQRGGAFLGRMAGEQGADDRRRQRMERAGDA